MFDLSGKIILCAGGAGFLGTPASQALAGQGATVVIASRNQERVGGAVKKVNDAVGAERASAMVLDMADERSIKQVVQEVVQKFGRLDAMVNATYHAIGKSVDELSGAEFDQSNHVHITGSFLLARESANVMQKGGSIIQYISMYGLVSPDPHVYFPPMLPNPVEYGVAKAGLNQMVKYLAAAYGPRGIRVNAISPGAFNEETDLAVPGFDERLANKTMLRRTGFRHETAGAVVYLASNEASYVTGATLCVDGGWTAW